MRRRNFLLIVYLVIGMTFVGCAFGGPGSDQATAAPSVSPTLAATTSLAIPVPTATADLTAKMEQTIQQELTRIGYAQAKRLTVGAGKQYATIQSAVNAAANGNVIVVYPGTYTEAVSITDKTVVLMGVDKTRCTLQYPNGDYMTPPLEMGSGRLLNMTVHATRQPKNPTAIAKAYAMHTDYDISRGQSLIVENVDFINDDYQALGIGLRGDFHLQFDRCRMICKTAWNAFFCHDQAGGGSATGQRLTVTNCYLENKGRHATIQIQSQEKVGSAITCTWIGNQVVNLKGGDTVGNQFDNPDTHAADGWMGMSFWQNSPNSKNNTATILNH